MDHGAPPLTPTARGASPRPSIRLTLGTPADGWALAALTTLTLFLFSDAVFRGQVFYERDIHLDWYTQVESFVRAIAARSWPVWDNAIAFGQPLLADPSAQILYPPTWLNLLVPPGTYYTLFVLFHVTLSGWGLYFLARSLEVSRAGALCAAALWSASGPLLSLVSVWHHFAGAAWIPWVLLAAGQAMKSPGRLLPALRWGAVQAAQVLAGSADMCVLTGGVVAVKVASSLEWRRPFHPRNRRRMASGLLAGAAAVGLSAALWVPALEVSLRSSRWSLPEEVRTLWSLRPFDLLQVFLAVPAGDDLAQLRVPFVTPVDSRGPFLPSLYLGLPAVGLVAASLVPARRRGRAPLLFIGGGASLLALGPHGPLYDLAVGLLPPLQILRYPSKAMILVALSWTLLAGIGFEAWRGREGRRRWIVVLGLLSALTVMAVVGTSLIRNAARGQGPGLRADAQHVTLSAVSGCVITALVAARATLGRPAPALLAMAAALAVADLSLIHRGLNHTAPHELLAFRPPAVDALKTTDRSRLYVYDYDSVRGKSERYLKREDPYLIRLPPEGWPLALAQVLSQRLYLFPPTAGRWGLEGSYDIDLRGLYPRALSNLTLVLRSVEGTPAHLRLLQMGSVRFMMALHIEGLEDLIPVQALPSLFPEPIRILRVPDPLPRTYAVGRVRVAEGEAALRTLLAPGFDPAHELVLAEGAAPDAGPSFQGASWIVDFRPDRVELGASLSEPGFVVLVDSYDPGWRAAIDGQPTPVLRANTVFRAVRVPAGPHQITFAYRPPTVTLGFVISTVTLLLLSAAGLGVSLLHESSLADPNREGG